MGREIVGWASLGWVGNWGFVKTGGARQGWTWVGKAGSGTGEGHGGEDFPLAMGSRWGN